MAKIDKLFRLMQEQGGSDLHLAAGQPPRIRLHGKMELVRMPTLNNEQVRDVLKEIASPPQWDTYEATGDMDFAYALEGVGRFRANYFRQQHGAGAVFRIIPSEILSLEKLNMPDAVARFADYRSGLVLVTGPTGSGKSTTLAAIIDRINEKYSKHIITVENPIEFVYSPKKSVISQREVLAHTQTFASALKAAIREDPDVILVGEMRDLETISLALTASEMGVLVFGTLHTNGAAKTIDRIIDVFPAAEKDQARSMLASSLSGVVSQLLLRKKDGGGRVAANEILIATQALPNIIREGNTTLLYSTMQSGRKEGMQTMDDALMAHLEGGRISAEDAFLKAGDKKRFESLLPRGA